MIDIHCHILPDCVGDDGAKNLIDAVNMARNLRQLGFKKIIATPHRIEGEALQNREDLQTALDSLNRQLGLEGIDIKVALGAEVFYHNEILARLKANQALTLAETAYVLIELPMRELSEDFSDLVAELIEAGYRPVIAHPERNRVISSNLTLLLELLKKGAYAQLNLGSLQGIYGQTAKDTALALLKAEAYQFIGSDLHHSRLNLEKSFEVLRKTVTTSYFEQLTSQNGEQLLKDESVATSVKPVKMKAIIKATDIKKTDKKKNLGKLLLASVAGVALVISGALLYVDHKIEMELQAAFADTGFDLNAELVFEETVPESGNVNTTETATDTKGNASASTPVETIKTTDSTSTTTSTSAGDSSNQTVTPAKAAPAKASTSVDLKKISLAEKAKAYAIVMGKLDGDVISSMKVMASDGFSPEEKTAIKEIFYTRFTAEEQQYLMNLYKKGK